MRRKLIIVTIFQVIFIAIFTCLYLYISMLNIENSINVNKYYITAFIKGITISSIIVIFFSYRFTKKITEPIYQLTSAIKKFALKNNDFDDSSRTQINSLAKHFERLEFELKEATNQFKDRNIKLNAIVNSMTEGVVAIDTNYKIILINTIAFSLLGLTQNPYSLEVFSLIRNTKIMDLIEKTMTTKEKFSKEIIIEINGFDKILNIHTSWISSNEINAEKNIGCLMVVEDITQIRKLEQLRTDFVSNVTHELKTPLTSIVGFIDTLKNGAIQDENVANRFLNIMDFEADRLNRLIDDILVLSEIETRDEDINVEFTNINEIITYISQILNEKALLADIDIILKLSENLPLYYCNSDRISQVIINLIDNAIKYTEHGTVTVTTSVVNNNIVILVEDTGIGIGIEHQKRIFERFYRADKGRSRKIGGTGLGLSIVKHIVNLYKGTVTVISELNVGTVFKITLPIVQDISFLIDNNDTNNK